ncbi:MAG: N-acetylmuramoyl-L-alanine amidase [Vicinamibacterales bacterium]
MRILCSLAAVLLLGLFVSSPLVAQGTPPATPLTLVSPDGRRAVPTTVVAGQELIALEDLASILPLTVREDPLAGGLTLTIRGNTVVLSQDQPLASVNGRVVSLPAAPVRSGRRWLVPIDVVPRALAPIAGVSLELRRPARLLILGDVRVPRVTARIDAAGPPTRATLEIAPAAPVTATTEGSRILVRIDADAVDLSLPAGAGLIDSFRPADQPNTIAIVLSPRSTTARATPATADDVTRVAIEVSSGAPAEMPVGAPLPGPPPADPAAVFRNAAVQTIVIDPGHGGDDAGVRSADGVLEKQITLDIARRLKAVIETRLGLRVLLTRDDDRTVALDERSALANNSKADLFLSLHVNGTLSPEVAGAEVFVLALDREGLEAQGGAEDAIAVPVLGGGMRSIDVIPWDLAQARHVDDSAVFASTVEQELRRRLRMGPRPIQRAPMRVLSSANMPALLVELAYLTNPDQAQAMQTAEFQSGAADALFDAIVRMRAYLEARRQ